MQHSVIFFQGGRERIKRAKIMTQRRSEKFIRKYSPVILFILLPVMVAVALFSGAAEISPAAAVSIFSDSTDAVILREIRLPRIAAAIFAGAAFALAGAILQSVLQNPLVSAEIMGISAGGGFSALLVLLLLPGIPLIFVGAASFCGAIITASAVAFLAWRRGVSSIRLILAGMTLGALLSALAGVLLILNREKVAGVIDYTFGSLSGSSWEGFLSSFVFVAAGFIFAFSGSRKLDIMMLGDESAASLGIAVGRQKILFLAAASLLAAGAVGLAGLLGFTGLIAPHIARYLVGPLHRRLLPASAAVGAILLLAADTLGRCVIAPREIPAGIALALLGPLFFLQLLMRSGRDSAEGE
jgi:iron complex transport system permease protein